MLKAGRMVDHGTKQTDRLKRIRWRCWRRGMRENDLLLGGFADWALDHLPESQLVNLESLLECSDQDLLAWMVGGEPAPIHIDPELESKIITYVQRIKKY